MYSLAYIQHSGLKYSWNLVTCLWIVPRYTVPIISILTNDLFSIILTNQKFLISNFHRSMIPLISWPSHSNNKNKKITINIKRGNAINIFSSRNSCKIISILLQSNGKNEKFHYKISNTWLQAHLQQQKPVITLELKLLVLLINQMLTALHFIYNSNNCRSPPFG